MSEEAVARAQGRRSYERNPQFSFSQQRRTERKLQKCENCGEEAYLVNGLCEECNLLMIIQRRKRKNSLLKKFGRSNETLDDDENHDLIKILSEDLEIQTNMTIENQGRIIKDQEDKLDAKDKLLNELPEEIVRLFTEKLDHFVTPLRNAVKELTEKVDEISVVATGKVIKKKSKTVRCQTCGQPLTKVQIARGAKYCSRKCFSEDLKAGKDK